MSLEQSPSFEERRESIRAKRIVSVQHRLYKHKGKKVVSPWQVSMTEDMSFTGLLFVSAVAYEVNDIVEVKVVMSGLLDIFKGYAQVVRQIKRKGDFYHIAVKYVDFKKPKTKSRSAKSHSNKKS